MEMWSCSISSCEFPTGYLSRAQCTLISGHAFAVYCELYYLLRLLSGFKYSVFVNHVSYFT